ncbi:hypothetical protein N9W89_00030 [Hellea sp.]|nr:hypothetical protein [Hellea sp.]
MNINSLAAVIISCCAILLIYCLHLSLIEWPAERTKNDHWAEQAKIAPENFQLICPPSNDGKPIPAENCKRSGQYEYDRQQQMLDHRAQISMKRASWVTAAFTGFGLLLVGITLMQAFKAATLAGDMLEEAETATVIAREGLVEARNATIVTREIGQKQSRAYMSVSGVRFESIGGGHYRATVSVENIGETPAINVRRHFAAGGCKIGQESELFAQFVPMQDLPSLSVIPPKSGVRVTPIDFQIHAVQISTGKFLSKAHEVFNQRPDYRIYIFGWITYEDVFGESHRTEFRWYVDKVVMDAGLEVKVAEDGNTMT